MDHHGNAEENQRGEDDPNPQAHNPAQPFGVGDGGQAEADEQDGAGGVGEVREAVAEDVGEHGGLARDTDQVSERNEDGHEQEGFRRAARNKEFDAEGQHEN